MVRGAVALFNSLHKKIPYFTVGVLGGFALSFILALRLSSGCSVSNLTKFIPHLLPKAYAAVCVPKTVAQIQADKQIDEELMGLAVEAASAPWTGIVRWLRNAKQGFNTVYSHLGVSGRWVVADVVNTNKANNHKHLNDAVLTRISESGVVYSAVADGVSTFINDSNVEVELDMKKDLQNVLESVYEEIAPLLNSLREDESLEQSKAQFSQLHTALRIALEHAQENVIDRNVYGTLTFNIILPGGRVAAFRLGDGQSWVIRDGELYGVHNTQILDRIENTLRQEDPSYYRVLPRSKANAYETSKHFSVVRSYKKGTRIKSDQPSVFSSKGFSTEAVQMTVFDLGPQDTILATSDWLDSALKWGSVGKNGLKTQQAAAILLNADTPEEGVRLLQRVANEKNIAADPNVPLDDEGTSILRPNAIVVKPKSLFTNQSDTYYFNSKARGGVAVSTKRDNASGAIVMDKNGQIWFVETNPQITSKLTGKKLKQK